VTYRMLALPMVAVAIVGLSACSSQQPGNATASTSTTSAPTSASTGGTSASPLASVDPCSLITQSEISSNGYQPGQTANAPDGRACRWERPDDGATVNGYVLEIIIYDGLGLSQLNTSGGTVTDFSVANYQGKLYQATKLNTCDAALPTSSTSRIDINVNSRLGIDTGCTLAKQIAPAVVSHLPAGR
jgi:hypothetical protein